MQNLCYFLQRHLYFSPEGNSNGTREITRLDITMQLLIQDIFSQIIYSYPYFPERICDFSGGEDILLFLFYFILKNSE